MTRFTRTNVRVAPDPLTRREDRPVAVEVQAPRGPLRQVELAAADVGTAVDHAHADAVTAMAQRELAAARQRAVGDAEAAGRERATAAEVIAVEAGAVPRRVRAPVAVQAP